MGGSASCMPHGSFMRLFGAAAVKPKKEKRATENEVDYRKLQQLLANLKETAKLKRDKAQQYQALGRKCRAANDVKGEKLNGAACVRMQQQALEIDKLFVNLDTLFEILQSRKLTQASLSQMRECLVYMQDTLADKDINDVDKFADELAAAIENSRELTDIVSGDALVGGRIISNREIDRALAAEYADADAGADAGAGPFVQRAPLNDDNQVELFGSDSSGESDSESESLARTRIKLVADNRDGFETLEL